MTMLNQDERVQLQELAQGRDLFARGYVDHEAELVNIRAAKEGAAINARFATTGAITLASTGLAAIDGVTPVAGDIALVKNQATSAQNGLYVASAGAWTRLKDVNGKDVITSGMVVSVQEGSAGIGTQWMLTTPNPIVVGTTTPMTYTQLTATGISAVTLASTAHGNGAALVGVEDAAGLITGATVEDALAELVKYIPVLLADPGTGVAIGVTRSAYVGLTIGSAGAETNTMAIPTFVGQRMIIAAEVVGTGTRAVTAAQAINKAGNTHMTFAAVRDTVVLEAVRITGPALRWEVTATDGAVLS